MSSVESLSDVELIDLLRAEDRCAFSEIYSRYWKRLFTIATNKLGDPKEAEEVVQEIFVSLWERRKKIQITTSLEAYLAVSVKYRVIKVLAKRNQYRKYADRKFISRSAFNNYDTPLNWLEFEELKSRLEVVIGNLPEKCRLIYKLSREQGLSQKQIAEECNVSEKTVEAHISKALKTLRSSLGQILL